MRLSVDRCCVTHSPHPLTAAPSPTLTLTLAAVIPSLCPSSIYPSIHRPPSAPSCYLLLACPLSSDSCRVSSFLCCPTIDRLSGCLFAWSPSLLPSSPLPLLPPVPLRSRRPSGVDALVCLFFRTLLPSLLAVESKGSLTQPLTYWDGDRHREMHEISVGVVRERDCLVCPSGHPSNHATIFLSILFGPAHAHSRVCVSMSVCLSVCLCERAFIEVCDDALVQMA